MSAGYNLAFDYKYSNDIKDKVFDMERKHPYWQPQLYNPSQGLMGGTSVATGRRSVGFNDYSKFNTFYQQTSKSYKSSGNDGYNYYHDNELNKINKSKMPYINYESNKFNNSNKPISDEDLEIFDSIKKNVKRNFNKGQLRGGKFKLNKTERLLHDIIVDAAKKSDSDMEGGISTKSFKKALKASAPVGRKIAATGVRVGLPLVSGAVAQSLGVPIPVAVGLSKIGADILAKKIEGGFKVMNPKDSQSLIADAVVRAANMSKRGGQNGVKEVDKSKYEKALDISKQLIKKVAKELAIAGARYSMKYILPMVAKEVAVRVGIDQKLAMELAQIAGNIIAGERPSMDSEGYIEVGKKPKGAGRNILTREEKLLHDEIVKAARKTMKGGCCGNQYEGGIDTKMFKKALKKSEPFVRQAAAHGVKVGLPLVAKEVGKTLGVPPVISGALGKAAGDVLSKHISKSGKGIGEYTGGGNMSAPKRRSMLVKKIMKEQNLSLPQASRYIKNNNIKY